MPKVYKFLLVQAVGIVERRLPWAAKSPQA